MKILNRPMFRMGGPIKEGIMNGIQEPKRGRVDGPGSYAGEAEIFANVQKTYEPPNFEKQIQADQIKDSQVINKDFLNKKFTDKYLLNEDARIKSNPLDFQFQYMTPDKYLNEVDEKKRIEIMSNPEAKNYFFDKFVQKNYADKIQKQKSIFEAAGDKRLNKTYGNERLEGTSGAPGGGDPRMYAKPKTIDEVIDQKPVVNDPELTKKERTNNILEMLGYDKAKKNALYDAMIKAGQRVSRTGLGADNLVSDVIQDTSTSYDKPEKLREAANLMDVQQQLKLDQIDASKTGGATAQNYQYFLDRGYDEKTASRKAEGLATNLLEAKSIGVEKQKLQGDKLTEYVAQSLIEMNGDDFENAEYRGTINSKDHDTVSEFAASTDFNGAGVYSIKGRVIEVDAKGNILTEQIVTSSTSDKKWWNRSE